MPESNFERLNTLPRPEQPATGAEQQPERQSERAQEVAAPRPVQRLSVRQIPSAALPGRSVTATGKKSEALTRIETVMEERLEEVYKSMSPEVRAEFKKRGEETATEVEELLYKVKVQSKKIFHLLFSWLKIIPGVNKYFLEQEAKLKTDELMRLKADLDRNRANQSVF